MNRSNNILYKLDDKPPLGICLIASIEHIIAMFAGLILCPLIVASAINLNPEDTVDFLALAIIAASLGTFLQATRIGPIGSGFLSIIGSSGTFISISIAAGLDGGLALICGMTFFVAPLKIILSFFARKIHFFFPRFIRGALVTLIGISILKVSLSQLIGPGQSFNFEGQNFINLVIALTVIMTTLLCMKSKFYLRITSIFIGIFAGSLLAWGGGFFPWPNFSETQIFTVPNVFITKLSFSWKHLLPFVIAYFITTIETLGDTYTLTEVSMPPEGRVSPERVRGGILASGIASLFAGAIGTMATTTYSGNISIIRITGVASRRVGILTSILLLPMAFSPILSIFLSKIPHPIIGASMLIALVFMIKIGIEILNKTATRYEKFLSYFVFIIALGLVFYPEIIPKSFPLRDIIINPICSCTILLLLLSFLMQLVYKNK